MRKIIKAIVAGAALVALSSCVNEFTAEVGEIKFGVNTTYGNGPATKTEYSGKDQNNNAICSTSTKERINWLSTDKVRILCQQASRVSGSEKYDDYMIVLGAEGSDETHTASLAPLPNGLQWGTGDHDFYAVYPSAIQSSYSSIVPEGSGATFVVHGGTIMAILERFAQPHQGYYHWQVTNGHGFITEFDGEKITVTEKI